MLSQFGENAVIRKWGYKLTIFDNIYRINFLVTLKLLPAWICLKSRFGDFSQ